MLIREALQWAQELLVTDSPRLDAEVLLAHILGAGRVYLISHDDDILTDQQETEFRSVIAKREGGTPIAHLTGSREFWSLSFLVSPATLIPRPDTELLVEWGLSLSFSGRTSVLDLGTGTGAIACALGHERPTWKVAGTDIRPEAVALARLNVERLSLDNVDIFQSDWFSVLDGQKFDLIVSNPPYIAADDPHLQQGDVRFEPASALVSGLDGMDDIKVIIEQGKDYLNAGGWMGLEHGYDQGDAVRTVFKNAGYSEIETLKDLGGHERISVGRLLP